MTHWGWYWKVKKEHTPKSCCDFFEKIDSFDLFKTWVRQYQEVGNTLVEFFRYKVKLVLADKNCIRAETENGTYDIPIEEKPCNYGGSYFFFHCPKCDKRMRILYCVKGFFLCRKCANLGYFIQRVRPDLRCLIMRDKIKEKIESRAGTLDRKPPWMKKRTYEQLKKRCAEYDGIKYSKAKLQEAIET